MHVMHGHVICCPRINDPSPRKYTTEEKTWGGKICPTWRASSMNAHCAA